MLGDRERLQHFQPSDQAVTELIERAEKHAGGTRFLVHGAQDAVAATFGVHAFLVDAARARLSGSSAAPIGTDRFVPSPRR